MGDGGAGSLEPAKIAAPIQLRALALGPKAVDFITLTIFETRSTVCHLERKLRFGDFKGPTAVIHRMAAVLFYPVHSSGTQPYVVGPD